MSINLYNINGRQLDYVLLNHKYYSYAIPNKGDIITVRHYSSEKYKSYTVLKREIVNDVFDTYIKLYVVEEENGNNV